MSATDRGYTTDYQLFSDDDLAAHAAAFEAACQAEDGAAVDLPDRPRGQS